MTHNTVPPYYLARYLFNRGSCGETASCLLTTHGALSSPNNRTNLLKGEEPNGDYHYPQRRLLIFSHGQSTWLFSLVTLMTQNYKHGTVGKDTKAESWVMALTHNCVLQHEIQSNVQRVLSLSYTFLGKNSYISVGSSSYTNNHSGSISYTGPVQKVQLAILIFLNYLTSLIEIPTKLQNLFES